MKVFAVYDKKAMFFHPLFTCENQVQAIRGFERTVKTADTDINEYPSDFALYYLADYDNEKGCIVPLPINQLVAEATDFCTVQQLAKEQNIKA